MPLERDNMSSDQLSTGWENNELIDKDDFKFELQWSQFFLFFTKRKQKKTKQTMKIMYVYVCKKQDNISG